jgi:hypothetical protein
MPQGDGASYVEAVSRRNSWGRRGGSHAVAWRGGERVLTRRAVALVMPSPAGGDVSRGDSLKIRLAAVAASTGFAASALLAGVPAGAQPAPLPLTIDPTSGADAVFTVSGEGCLLDDVPGVIDVFVDGQPLTNDDPENPDLADPDGSWIFEISPDPGTGPVPPGVVEITATCTVNDGSGTEIVQYAPAAYEVTAAPEPEPAPEAPAPAPEAPAPAVPVVAQPTFTG